MIRLLDKSKTSFFNYFYIFCIFIYAGSATVFARNLGDIRTFGNAFAIVITVIFFLKNKIHFTKPFFISIGVFLLYAVITSINNKLVNPRWISEWIIWLTMAYGICQGLKDKLFVVVESLLLHLCIIALICWIIHLLMPDIMTEFVKKYAFSEPYEEDGNVIANMIFYTINDDTIENEFSFLLRNPGFAWEPGAFASIVCLGIFCNMLRTNFNIFNPSLWVFLLALASSQSTTGFLVFLAMVFLYFVINRKYTFLLLSIPIIIIVFNLPFVKEKLIYEFETVQYLDYNRNSGALGRLYSLQLNFEEFLRHPIIGLGGYTEGTWLAQHNYDVATISGIGNLLVYYGAIMTLLFFGIFIKSCNYIKKTTNSKNAVLLLVTILGIMVSYNLWKQPIFIAFWMFGIYGSEYVVKETKNKHNKTKLEQEKRYLN